MSLARQILPQAANILRSYYGSSHLPLVLQCLRAPVDELGDAGRVLFREASDAEETVELGLEFGTSLHARLERATAELLPHDLAVVAEELSHMNLLIDACSSGGTVSRLDLEVLGEIDRFLVLMHWNASSTERPLARDWKNLDQLSDALFSGPRFAAGSDARLYVMAEGSAFAHLRRAFGRAWDASRPDFGKVDAHARDYLQWLRGEVLTSGRPARLAQSA